MKEEIKSPMPGTIIEVLVQKGDEVQAGQNVIILESMKMENPIPARMGGTVNEILVNIMDKVRAHQTMVLIE